MTLRLCGMYERGMLGNSVEGCATSVDSGRWEAKDDGHEEMQYIGKVLVERKIPWHSRCLNLRASSQMPFAPL